MPQYQIAPDRAYDKTQDDGRDDRVVWPEIRQSLEPRAAASTLRAISKFAPTSGEVGTPA